jgi:hypothetical protein
MFCWKCGQWLCLGNSVACSDDDNVNSVGQRSFVVSWNVSVTQSALKTCSAGSRLLVAYSEPVTYETAVHQAG